MTGLGSIMLIWGGRFSGGALLVSGTSHLWPVPPALNQELHAMFLCVAAMVPLTIGEFIAFYVAVLETTPKSAAGLRQVKTIQRQAFSVFRDGAIAMKKIYEATLGHFQRRTNH